MMHTIVSDVQSTASETGAVVRDGVVLTAPTVQEPITSGAVQVGNLSEAAAEALAQRLGGAP